MPRWCVTQISTGVSSLEVTRIEKIPLKSKNTPLTRPHGISHWSGLMKIENRELQQLQNQTDMLKVSLNKINAQIHKKGKQRMLLEEKKTMMEMDFLGRLKVRLSQC